MGAIVMREQALTDRQSTYRTENTYYMHLWCFHWSSTYDVRAYAGDSPAVTSRTFCSAVSRGRAGYFDPVYSWCL